jgi:hypothetical protein
MKNRGLIVTTAAIALAIIGCARESSQPDSTETAATARPMPKPKPTSTTAAATRPASLAGMPGPLTPEPGFQHGRRLEQKAPVVNLKHTGTIGEVLEGDVYSFKLLSLGPCGEQPDPKMAKVDARRVVAAEVEITAKQELNVSPRDVVIGVGGVSFAGSVDQKRTIEGCTPLLKFSRLPSKQVAKGFVLFDVPVTGPGSDLAAMGLRYQPTRFGGAGSVLIPSLATAAKPRGGR